MRQPFPLPLFSSSLSKITRKKGVGGSGGGFFSLLLTFQAGASFMKLGGTIYDEPRLQVEHTLADGSFLSKGRALHRAPVLFPIPTVKPRR